MRVSYQHANIRSGNESTLLRFSTGDGTQACVLVDAGAGVDLDDLLGPDEYLNAVIVTHAHIDHYRSLGKNLRHSAPVYTSPATAAVLEHALPEAAKDNDVGDVSAAVEAIEPITDWTAILPQLEVRPIPAGHAPGASAFVFRFEDEAAEEPLEGRRHLVVTGDFTRRPCAGYPGFPEALPMDVDAVFLNVARTDDYESVLDESVHAVLERALAGSQVVVAAGSLTGVHYASVLAEVSEAIGRRLPITIVGQAARLYEVLEYTHQTIELQEVFDDPSSVLEPGHVTIAGPAAAHTGSAERLFGAVRDDPGALFVHLGPENTARTGDSQCTVRQFPVSNHPSVETIEAVVDDLAPRQVVVKHARGGTLNEFQRRFDRCFVWGNDDASIQDLYVDGHWVAPQWISETAVRRIRRRRWEAVGERPTTDSLPSLSHGAVDLASEGIDVDALCTAFGGSGTNPYERSDEAAVTAVADAAGRTADAVEEPPQPPETAAPDTADESASVSETAPTESRAVWDPSASAAVQTATDGVGEEGVESAIDAAGVPAVDLDDEALEREILRRLVAIEQLLQTSDGKSASDATVQTVDARVLGGGGERLLQVLGDLDVEPGSIVRVSVERVDLPEE